MADEASEYMTTAVQSYHDAFSNGGYNQLTADYAKENYATMEQEASILPFSSSTTHIRQAPYTLSSE